MCNVFTLLDFHVRLQRRAPIRSPHRSKSLRTYACTRRSSSRSNYSHGQYARSSNWSGR